jgi:A/G-specific adenine glycosylase
MSTPQSSDEHGTLTDRLLTWFAEHARDLPWRVARTPYRVWIAEVMLQQTQVDTVIPYYERFLDRFPSVQALANASMDEVLKSWEGLGYYARARNLHAAAQRLVETHGGRLPGTCQELLALPGIGRYIGGAIASIAFDAPIAAVDGNARRVLSRVFDVRGDVTRSAVQRELEGLATQLLPADQAGTFNEALMELGALVCTSQQPACGACPLQAGCQAYATGNPEALPVRRARRRVPHYDVAAAVIHDRNLGILVAQRNLGDMLGGLWEFPGGKCETGETLPQCLAREIREELGVEIRVRELLVVVPHAYTHFRITLHAFWCQLVSGEPRCLDCASFRWIRPAELDALPMSVADRKVARFVQQHRPLHDQRAASPSQTS